MSVESAQRRSIETVEEEVWNSLFLNTQFGASSPYEKIHEADDDTILQRQATVNIVRSLSKPSSKSSPAHKQNEIRSLALNI